MQQIRQKVEDLDSRDYRGMVDLLPAGRPPVAYFCPYVPEELIWAAGGHPFRLVDRPVELSQASAHLPAYCCHPVKSYLQQFLQGDLDFLRGVVFSHSCDAYKGLAEIWSRRDRPPFSMTLMIPTRLDSDLARAFLKNELLRFREDLERVLGPFKDEALAEALTLFGNIREQLRRLYQLRRAYPALLPGDFFARIIRAGFWLDRYRYQGLLEEVNQAVSLQPPRPDSRITVYLTGNLVHDPYWFSVIEESGGLVVWDDLCSGARTLRLAVPERDDPLEALTDRYFGRCFCPTKSYGPRARQDVLAEEIAASGARGLIFLLYKYCEPHFFDFPDLRQFFAERGIPSLLLEVEDPAHTREQAKVRIQAFMEMLETG